MESELLARVSVILSVQMQYRAIKNVHPLLQKNKNKNKNPLTWHWHASKYKVHKLDLKVHPTLAQEAGPK